MIDSEDKPWLIDGRTGRVVTREELPARLNQRPATVQQLCQPASTLDALMEITVALAKEANQSRLA